MSLENPTRLRIGMRGNFAGRDFRLLGRVVMGVEINGEVYYWNEFNLQAESAESATLVFEDSDQGGEWRLFTMFEPESPMTAADAVTKQVGDRLNLNGTDVTVTLVSSSRVYRIEGLPPEGVRVGSEANYFNAEAGDVMQVVSWTGVEVEYYNGFTLGAKSVDTAFNLPPAPAPSMFSRFNKSASLGDSDNGNGAGIAKFLIQIGVVVLILWFIFGRGFSCSRGSETMAVKPVLAPSSLLVAGMTGHWGGKNFHVTAHAVVEIDQVEAIYERNEYELTDDLGQVAWLVCGDRPDSRDWTLYAPLTPVEPPTPQASATQKVGDPVNIDGLTGTIHNLFRYSVKHLDNTGSTGWHTNDVQYGYAVQSDYNLLEVRWNNGGISFYHGKNIPAKDVKDFVAAFTAAN